MSTHAFLGVKSEAGEVGRYLHYDGFPDNVLLHLRRMIDRDGPEKVCSTLLRQDRGGWSYLNCNETTDLEGSGMAYIPGYGAVYRDLPPGPPQRLREAIGRPCHYRYAYLIDPDTGDIDTYQVAGSDLLPMSTDEAGM